MKAIDGKIVITCQHCEVSKKNKMNGAGRGANKFGAVDDENEPSDSSLSKRMEEGKSISNHVEELAKKTLWREQHRLAEAIRAQTQVSIVTCGHCGAVLLHRNNDEVITCPYCLSTLDQCDCPDYACGQWK